MIPAHVRGLLASVGWIAAAWLTCALAPSASAGGGFTFYDGTFTGWQQTYFETGGGSASMVVKPSGGNPGVYAEATDIIGGGAPYNVIYLLMWNDSFLWVPSVKGPLKSVTLDIDAKWVSGGGSGGQALLPLLKQNGRYYIHSGTVTGQIPSWQHITTTSAYQDDFCELYPVNCSSHPDFSINGAGITFGFATANSANDPKTIIVNYDNWALSLDPAPTGRVVLQDLSIPMTGVTVHFVDYWNNSFSTTTNHAGLYVVPSIPPGSYKVFASLGFSEPSSGLYSTIVNYPNNDPMRRYHVGSTSDNDIPTIVFPEPVILQAGWRGDRTTFDTFRSILQADPALPSSYTSKPAFMCFRMPNSTERVGGYRNSGKSDHASNGTLLKQWIQNSVRSVLSTFIDGSNLDRVSYSVVAHSMGGIITRAMVTSAPSPRIYRLVGLDCPHGGTKNLAAFGADCDNMREWYLNGKRKHNIFTGANTWTVRGWNESYIDSVHSWLSYSCVPDGVVSPDISAWGSGHAKSNVAPMVDSWDGLVSRWILKPLAISVTSLGHIDLHESPLTVGEVAKFLWTGVSPPVSQISDSNEPQTDSDELGAVDGELVAQSGVTASQAVSFDQSNAVYGRMVVIGAGAGYTLWGPDGSQIIPNPA